MPDQLRHWLARPAPVLPWVSCGLILLVLWGTLAAGTLREVYQIRQKRTELAQSTAKGFAEFAGLNLLVVDRMLQDLREHFDHDGTLPPQPALAADLSLIAPMVLQVSVTDAAGRVVASTLPGGGASDMALRPFFLAAQLDPSDRLLLSTPVANTGQTNAVVQMVRPRRSRDGEFAGVIVAGIDTSKLESYFGTRDSLPAGASVLIAGRQDGLVRASMSSQTQAPVVSLLTSDGWNRMTRQSAGAFETSRTWLGTSDITGFHQVADYPLVVTMSSRVEPWREIGRDRLAIAMGLALAFSVMLLALTRLRVRNDARQQALIAQLQESRERERDASELKSSFLASVSHELRTPLNAILGFSELIRDMTSHPTTRRYSDLIHGSAQHLHSLVNTLLDLARIEAGRMEVDLEEVDLGKTLQTLVEMHSVTAGKKGLPMTLNLEVPGGQRIVADTDRTKWVQVINNVLHNAVKFTDEGAIWVTGVLVGDAFVVRVVDTGPGIPADRMQQVFSRFVRAVDELSPKEGSGLGLALSRELMTLLGGSIVLSSDLGQGTQVEVSLPHARRIPAG